MPFSSRDQLPPSQFLVPGWFLQIQKKMPILWVTPPGWPGQWAQERQPHMDPWQGGKGS